MPGVCSKGFARCAFAVRSWFNFIILSRFFASCPKRLEMSRENARHSRKAGDGDPPPHRHYCGPSKEWLLTSSLRDRLPGGGGTVATAFTGGFKLKTERLPEATRPSGIAGPRKEKHRRTCACLCVCGSVGVEFQQERRLLTSATGARQERRGVTSSAPR